MVRTCFGVASVDEALRRRLGAESDLSEFEALCLLPFTGLGYLDLSLRKVSAKATSSIHGIHPGLILFAKCSPKRSAGAERPASTRETGPEMKALPRYCLLQEVDAFFDE